MFLKRLQPRFGTLLACTLAAAMVGCMPSAQDAEIYEVSNASIRTPLPGRTITAGYFDFKNQGDAAATIVGVSSDIAASIEMHTITKIDGQMRMRPLSEIAVEPGAVVTFASGGNHLMLFDVELGDSPSTLKIELASGDIIEAPFHHTRVIEPD
jgi:copper(I)-binding protein